MKKNIKLYLHHDYFEKLSLKGVSSPGDLIKRILLYPPLLVFEIFFVIGLIVLGAINLPRKIIQEFRHAPETGRKFKNIFKQSRQFRRTLIIFLFLTLSCTSLVFGAEIIAAGQQLKGRVLGTSDQGFKYLQDARSALESSDISRAEENFALALRQFESSETQLGQSSALLKGLMAAVPQKQDADKLLEAAQLMTNAALKGTSALAITQGIKVSPEGLNAPESDLEFNLHELQRLINEGADDIIAATSLLKDVSITTIPEDKRQAFLEVRDLLTTMEGSMTSLRDVGNLLTSIALGKKSILLVFQNNNELRATGGFIGTVGSARLSHGAITNLDIRSVYDFDGQLREWILPPKPMYSANNRWYLRDSNWFADFKQSATRMIALFEKEGGETPDLVMAITPDVIVGILERTGPVLLPQYGVTLTAENFVETIQTSTSIAYGKELNQPKQLLADFFPALMQTLGATTEGLVPLIEILQLNLAQKNIQLYARDEALQSSIESFNWGGRIHETDRDYLAVVSSNLSGTKTDLYLKRQLDVLSEISDQGKVTNTVTLTVDNPLPPASGLANRSFIRFLVPKGSRLLASEGFTKHQLPDLSDPKYITDPDIVEWEKELQIDSLSGTFTGTEAGKTFFGNWLELKGGESKTVTLKYSLPYTVGNLDRMGFVLQRQPGATPMAYQYRALHPGRDIIWKTASNFSQDAQSITTSGTLTSDAFIGMVLEEQK